MLMWKWDFSKKILSKNRSNLSWNFGICIYMKERHYIVNPLCLPLKFQKMINHLTPDFLVEIWQIYERLMLGELKINFEDTRKFLNFVP
jgi:hypothetical protein